MKYIFILLLFSVSAYGEVTRAQLRDAIQDVNTLSHQQKTKLQQARYNLKIVQQKADNNIQWGMEQYNRADTAEKNLAKETLRAEKEHKAASQNAKERDVFVVLFAIALTIAAVSLLMPVIGKLPSPWGVLAPIGACFLLFGAFYGIIRVALRFITNLV